MISTSARPWYMIILPPERRNGRRSASSVLMCAKLRCRTKPWSYASANRAYESPIQPFAPFPVALMNDGVASVGFCSSSATRSVEIVNGAATPALLPPRPPKLAPRVSPYHTWLPRPMCKDQLLSADGGGAVPSRVWPYHSLFIAWACNGVTQLTGVFGAVHRTFASTVGS